MAKCKDLLYGQSVCQLTGHEFEPIMGKTFVEQVTEFFAKQGGIAHSSFGDVILDKKGIKSDKAHGIGNLKRSAFAAIKDVLENGIVILQFDYHNIHGKYQPTGMISAPITIAGVDYICVVVVIGNITTKRLYVHEVELKKKLLDAVVSNQVHDSKTTSPQHQGEIAKVLRNFILNNYKTKINTENNNSQDSDEINNANYNTSQDSKKENSSKYIMTYNEKKSLYESIMIDIAKMVKRQINEAVIKDGYVLDQYLDEKNDIKIRFGIKSTSKEDSMFFYSAFLDATSQSLNSLFIKVQGAGKTNKEWAKNVTKDTFDRLDDMIEKIYRACFKGTTNGYTLAKKMKSVAPKLGFEFIYKVVEDA